MKNTYRYDLQYKNILYPHVPLILSHKGSQIIVQALVDTGATHSLIDGEIASLLNHDLRNKQVIRRDIDTAGKAIRGYQHSFRVQILESNDCGLFQSPTFCELRRFFSSVAKLATAKIAMALT